MQEVEWAIQLARGYGKPVAATMCIGKFGDGDGVSTGECAVRMAKAGADLVGVNCLFDPYGTVEAMKLVKVALDKEGLKPFLMCQTLGYMTPDAITPYGWVDLADFAYGKYIC